MLEQPGTDHVIISHPTHVDACAVFLTQLVSRNSAAKVGRAGITLSLDQLIAEAWDYMQQFASFLLENGMTKVRYVPGSVLFARDDELKRFFDFNETTNSLGEIRRLVLDISPISNEGGVFSFSHKSILEFLVAKQVRDDIIMSVKRATSSSLSLFRLSKILDGLPADANDERSDNTTKQADSNLGAIDIAWLESQLKSLTELALKSKGSEARRVAKVLRDLVKDVAESAITSIDLEEEEAVRDFLIDALLDDVQFCSAFKVVARLCRLNWLHGGVLSGLAYDNILVACTSKSHKHGDANLLRVASAQDNLFLLKTAIKIVQDAAGRIGIEHVQDELLGQVLQLFRHLLPFPLPFPPPLLFLSFHPSLLLSCLFS